MSYPICLQDEWYQHWCHPPLLSKCVSAVSQNSDAFSVITKRGHYRSAVTCGVIVDGLTFSLCFCLFRWHNLRSWFKCWKFLRTAVSLAQYMLNGLLLNCINLLFWFSEIICFVMLARMSHSFCKLDLAEHYQGVHCLESSYLLCSWIWMKCSFLRTSSKWFGWLMLILCVVPLLCKSPAVNL